MKIRFLLLFVFGGLIFFDILKAQEPSDENAIFRLEYEKDPKAKAIEIEWLKTNKPNETIGHKETIDPDKKAINGKSVFSKSSSSIDPYFRIRSIDEHDLPGPWSEVFITKQFIQTRVQEVAKIEKSSKPKKKLIPVSHKESDRIYLLGNEFSVELPEAVKDITYYSVNQESEIKYKDSILFSKPGQYDLNLKAYENNNTTGPVIWKDHYNFWVDQKPPHIKLFIWAPFEWKNGKLIISQKSKFQIFSWDNDSGVENIYAHLTCDETNESNQATTQKSDEANQALDKQKFSPWDYDSFFGSVTTCANATLAYFARDKVGNETRIKTINFAYTSQANESP